MSYEAAIALFGGDETTLTKSFIMSLENIAAQFKEKFLVNFQGFQVDVSTKEDFFSY
jgi:hypothetical protein